MATSYRAHLLQTFYRGAFPWARDNLVWGAFVLVVPPIAATWLGLSHSIDWPLVKTSLLFYFGSFMIYAAARLVKAVFKLDKERSESLEAERLVSQALRQQLALQEEAAHTSGSSADWDALGDRFQHCSKSARVDYQITQGITSWDIKEDRTLEILCKKAGALLLKSPKSRSVLMPILGEDTLSQWLNVVKSRAASYNTGHQTEHLDDGSSLLHIFGSISGLADASYQLCMECSAYEI